MRLPVNHPHVSKMRNPTRVIYDKKGPERTFYGPVTNLRYRFGGKTGYTWVDERDAKAFVNPTKRGKSFFKIDPNQERDDILEPIFAPEGGKTFEDFLKRVAVPTVVQGELVEKEEEEEEEEEETDEEVESYNFTLLNGIGIKAMEFINENGIVTLEQLRDAGLDFVLSMPYVNEEKATSILQQVEELLNSEEE